MVIEEPRAEVLAYTQLPPGYRGRLGYEEPCGDMALVVERCGRVSWKSEGKIEKGSASGFMTRVVNIRKDESIAEHASVTMLLVTDRYASHQIVRHRIAAYTQESTHYIDYSKKGDHPGQIVVMRPLGIPVSSPDYEEWKRSCMVAEAAYFNMLRRGTKHYHARFVLPGCLKTEIAVTYNLRMWLHVLKQRTTPNNTPEIVRVMKLAGHEMAKLCPDMFADFVLLPPELQAMGLEDQSDDWTTSGYPHSPGFSAERLK